MSHRSPLGKQIVKGGFVEGLGDAGGGAIALICSLLLVCGGLMGLNRILKFLFLLGQVKKAVIEATLTLGANISTTATALIAPPPPELHLGWEPHRLVPPLLQHLRHPDLVSGAHHEDGAVGSCQAPEPLCVPLPLYVHVRFILVAFAVFPGVLLGVAPIFDASVAGGIVVLLILRLRVLVDPPWRLLQGPLRGRAGGGRPHTQAGGTRAAW